MIICLHKVLCSINLRINLGLIPRIPLEMLSGLYSLVESLNIFNLNYLHNFHPLNPVPLSADGQFRVPIPPLTSRQQFSRHSTMGKKRRSAGCHAGFPPSGPLGTWTGLLFQQERGTHHWPWPMAISTPRQTAEEMPTWGAVSIAVLVLSARAKFSEK